MLKLIVTFVLAAGASVATAEPGKSKSRNDPNRVICRSEEVTGSHLQVERRCMTMQQWADRARDQRQNLEQAQRSGAGGFY